MNAPPSSESDIQAAQTPSIVRAAGGSVLGAGALVLLVAVQTFSGFTLSTRATVMCAVLAVVGAASTVIGVLLMRARAGSAVLGVVAGVVLFLVTTGWLLASMAGGLLSLFAIVAPPLSLLAVTLSALSVGACRRVVEARARLLAQGLDLGT
jgi:hypothetical protein